MPTHSKKPSQFILPPKQLLRANYSLSFRWKLFRHLSKKWRVAYLVDYGKRLGGGDKLTEGSDYILALLHSSSPFFVTRIGAAEGDVILEKYKKECGYLTDYSEPTRRHIMVNAGVFPNDSATLDRFADLYFASAQEADVLGLWGVPGEDLVFYGTKKPIKEVAWNSLYPGINGWSAGLAGKRVLVVHPFVKTIRQQYNSETRHLIFSRSELLPDFELLQYKPVVSLALEKTEFANWFEALEHMQKDLRSMQDEFDVCLLGCGAYGLPLGRFVYKLGKQVIHVGGSLQLLFGISGRTFERRPLTKDLMNEHWVYPLTEETPARAYLIEDGCYYNPAFSSKPT